MHLSNTPLMSAASKLAGKLRLPCIGAPLFIVSTPDLVIAQCKAGIVGSFPALNARPKDKLDEWLVRIKSELAEHDAAHPDSPAAPFAVNQIVHRSNDRLMHDLEACVPLVITSLGAREDVNQAIHSYGGLVFHDVINNHFAKKAIREWFDGPLCLSGSIATGSGVLAAQALGADFAYMGSAFIASAEANAQDAYKQSIVESVAADIVYSSLFTGVHGNYLRPSIMAAGLDPDNLPEGDVTQMDFGSGGNTDAKAWKDIWGCGQGIGAIKEVSTAGEIVERLKGEYAAAVAESRAATGRFVP
ncbi:hypothetical protein EMIHUDRAFT_459824 [Emiliania huxleyi CCMP1516]|uniref:Nitronate monooxygenase domain-containing protein n=2 Tax=Emiliania huxleyi TaxID=2903 RepID=A0A0D3IHM7_EMIH1|nr:hypothetical protein EMIHUDRAFT_459824 [Emiliania huxleyi CCMP1516]EOD10762.1 hypothetical protein EMIHUDRAFT_459824 [Emiliania huxleyi CCMP1516]|eukprot:XP_005763191.1 hypothetical protein EMIHUDRAFT_459824 [Emiliania huxleyi CCMP1516]